MGATGAMEVEFQGYFQRIFYESLIPDNEGTQQQVKEGNRGKTWLPNAYAFWKSMTLLIITNP